MAMNGIILKDVTVLDLNGVVIPSISFRSMTLSKKTGSAGTTILVANLELQITHAFEEYNGPDRTLAKRELYLQKKSGDLNAGMVMNANVVSNDWIFELVNSAGNRTIGDGDLMLGFAATKVGPGSGNPAFLEKNKKTAKKKVVKKAAKKPIRKSIIKK